MGASAKLLIPNKKIKVDNLIYTILKLCNSDSLLKKEYLDEKTKEKNFYFKIKDNTICYEDFGVGYGFLKFSFYSESIKEFKNLYFDYNYIHNGESHFLLSANSSQLNALLFYKLQNIFGGYLNYIDYDDNYTYKKTKDFMVYKGEQEDKNYSNRLIFIDKLSPIKYNDFFNPKLPKEFNFIYSNKEILDTLKIFQEKEDLENNMVLKDKSTKIINKL